MSLLRFFLNGPLRRRIRRLQAQLELLTGRVERLEESIAAASFPIPARSKNCRNRWAKTFRSNVKLGPARNFNLRAKRFPGPERRAWAARNRARR
ncbi:hypothetical protein HMSSN036_60100 [Paenibacillus macerans]|nr:hypothetical protein HMSSN036_60100 [Paenibacillus macerans]